MIVLSKTPYGSIEDTKLENSIKRSLMKLEKAGMVILKKLYTTRLYEIIALSDSMASSWQNPNNELTYQVKVLATGKHYIVNHYYPSHLNKTSYWIFREDNQ